MSYTKQTFEDNVTVLKAEHLRHIEDGIEELEATVDNLTAGGGSGLTSRQTVALNSLFALCAYNADTDTLQSAYTEFKVAFGLETEDET